jgi:hypothetical protein
MAGRLRESVGALGGPTGLDPGQQGLECLAGRVPVDGQLGGQHRWRGADQLGPLGEGVGVGGVEPGPFAGQQVGIDQLAE